MANMKINWIMNLVGGEIKRELKMGIENNYKLSILYTYMILKEETDSEHTLTQVEIGDKIEAKYGMKLNRKTIASNILSLQDFGCDIQKTNGGIYLLDRVFEVSEIQFLIDAVFSSKSLNGKYSRELANKLSSFLSKYQKRQYNYIYKSEEVNRTDSKTLFYNIDIINEAIEKNKKIKFSYDKFFLEGEKSSKKKTYLVSPYYLINNQGRYYLVCNYDIYDDISNYKVEKISNICIEDEERKPIQLLKTVEGKFDIVKYANENIYMFGDKSIYATVKILNNYVIDYIEEWFGKNAKFYKKDGNNFADIKTSEKSLLYWCLQYSTFVELISPDTTREKLKEMIKKIYKIYFD